MEGVDPPTRGAAGRLCDIPGKTNGTILVDGGPGVYLERNLGTLCFLKSLNQLAMEALMRQG